MLVFKGLSANICAICVSRFLNSRVSVERTALVKIQDAEYIGEYKVRLRFDTGEEGVADLADVITRYSAARPLIEYAEFAKFTLDEWPTLVWPCGFDLSPEMLYERVTGKRPAWQQASVHEKTESYRSTKD